jgi:Adenylate and Guanylate cyclase catalytic domain
MIEHRVRRKTLRRGLRLALVSGAISAVTTALIGPGGDTGASAGLAEAGTGLLMGTLIPSIMTVAVTYGINTRAVKRLPYAAVVGLSFLLLACSTLLAYLIVGVLVWPDQFFHLEPLLIACSLSAFISFASIVANVTRQFAGPGVLSALLLGRYHRAREEDRVFVFVDLVGSTPIAEQLGSARFFALLRDFHAIVEASCFLSDGALYKYLGDGAILVWHGTAAERALRCVLELRDELHAQAETLKQRYGVTVAFTAGLHCGTVTVGELGAVKWTPFFGPPRSLLFEAAPC